jgi:hypothetical protein
MNHEKYENDAEHLNKNINVFPRLALLQHRYDVRYRLGFRLILPKMRNVIPKEFAFTDSGMRPRIA